MRLVVEAEVCQAIRDDTAITMEDIREAVGKCPLSQKIKEMIASDAGSEDPELEPYSRVKHQLCVVKGVICKGNKIFIPPSLQRKATKLSHKAHQGMAKAKAFARSFCWYPGIDRDIEQKVRVCQQCQAVQSSNQEQPVKPMELPEGPWQQLEMDFQGPYPSGEYIFVMIDRYTRWPEAKILRKAPDAKVTTKAMKDIFTNKGTPELCQSDNGPPFQSREMEDFARKCGYKHKHITPEWPRANGMVERFNRTMKEAVQAAHLEGKGVQEAAKEFLEVYRATPHSATNVSPYEAMHGGRRMKTTLPILTQEGDTIDREKEKAYKEKMASNSRGKHHSLKEGDKVLIRQQKRNKLTPNYRPVEMTVTEIKGSSITATDGRTSIFRDASHFKRIESEDEEDEADQGQPAPTEDQDGTDETGPECVEEADLGAGDTPTEMAAQPVEQPQWSYNLPRRENRGKPPVRLKDYVC